MTPATATNDGNADDFIEFFRRELQVFIERRYRTHPYKVLIGHSAGGLFALHTLFHQPDTFNAYIALSPAIWSDDAVFLDELKEVLSTGREFDNNLFTSLATEGDDEQAIYDELVAMITNADPARLEFSHMAFPEESHSSTIMPGIYYGILAMYKNWILPDSVNSLDALLAHYRNLSEHYGYTVDVPVKHASNLGFKLVDNGDPEGGLEVFEYSLANIWQDAIAYYSVAYAMRRLGRLDEALAGFEKASNWAPVLICTAFMSGSGMKWRRR